MRCEEDTLLNRPKSSNNPYIYWFRCREQIKKIMKLGKFEVIQLFKGAIHLSNPTKNEQKLLSKIMGFLLSNDVEFELNQDEVHPAYDFICRRISHCTRERDMKSRRFNSKTYENLLLLKDAIRYNHPYTIVENY